MFFVKRVVIWASIWTLVVMSFVVVQTLRAGQRLDVAPTLFFAVVVWVPMAGLVTFSKIMTGARRFGSNLGRAVVKNPRQEAGGAVGNAMDDALRRAGAKRPDSGNKS